MSKYICKNPKCKCEYEYCRGCLLSPIPFKSMGFCSQKCADEFKTHKPTKNACIKDLSITLKEYVHFCRHGNEHHSSLDLSGMFYPDDKPICAKCIPLDIAKAKCCARNLRTGMCQDNFIKQTLGTILFPQHYGMQK